MHYKILQRLTYHMPFDHKSTQSYQLPKSPFLAHPILRILEFFLANRVSANIVRWCLVINSSNKCQFLPIIHINYYYLKYHIVKLQFIKQSSEHHVQLTNLKE